MNKKNIGRLINIPLAHSCKAANQQIKEVDQLIEHFLLHKLGQIKGF